MFIARSYSDEVSTTRVSGWVKNSTRVVYSIHPLTRMVLTSDNHLAHQEQHWAL